MSSTPVGQRNSDPPFYTADVKDILRSIKTTKQQKQALEQRLAAHITKTIESRLQPALLDELRRMEDEELELVRIDVSLRERLVEALQQARRFLYSFPLGVELSSRKMLSKVFVHAGRSCERPVAWTRPTMHCCASPALVAPPLSGGTLSDSRYMPISASHPSCRAVESRIGRTATAEFRSRQASNPFLEGRCVSTSSVVDFLVINPECSMSSRQSGESDAAFSQEFFSLNLKREEIEIKQEVQLGKGAYGSVFEGRYGEYCPTC